MSHAGSVQSIIRTLPQPKPDVLPSDFFVNDSGRKGGVTISVRLDPDTAREIDLFIQLGEEFASWPKTKSDVIRNSIHVYIRRAMDAVKQAALGVGDPELIDLLNQMHYEQELKKRQEGEKRRKEALDSSFETTKGYIQSLLESYQPAMAMKAAQEYLDQIRGYTRMSPEKGKYVWEKMHGDNVWNRQLSHLELNGFPVRQIEEDELDRIIMEARDSRRGDVGMKKRAMG